MPWQRKDRKWIGQVREGEKRIQKTLPTKAEALSWESRQREIPVEQWQTRTGSSIGELANEYLDYSKIRHSEKTYQEKRDFFKRFFQQIDSQNSFLQLTPDMVRMYLQRQGSLRSGYAANKDRKNLYAWGGWLNRYKGLVGRALNSMERFPETRQGRYVPPEEDFWEVYEVAQGQDKIMLLAYLHLAARRSELFRLRWDDVDWGGRKLRLMTRKRLGGAMEADWLPLTDDLYASLISHRDFVGGEWVFPAPSGGPYKVRQHVMAKLCRRAGVRKFGWHAIRHLTATLLAQADVPMITISQILRHKNLGTTERYLKRMGHLKEALELLGRKAF